MSEFSEGGAQPQIVQYGGKVYRLAPQDTLDVVALWEGWLEEQAFAALERQAKRAKWIPPQQEAKEQALLERITAGAYGFFSQVSSAQWTNPFMPGFKKMVYFQLLPYQPDVSESVAAGIAETKRDEILKELRRNFPNAFPPETGASESEPKASTPSSLNAESSQTNGAASPSASSEKSSSTIATNTGS